MLCCRYERKEIATLPFGHFLDLDYYDGSLQGFTYCRVCKQMYYFEMLEWDAETQDYRVFKFSAINNNTNILKNAFKRQSEERKKGNYRFFDDDLAPYQEFLHLPLTHICASDDNFQTGLWRCYRE